MRSKFIALIAACGLTAALVAPVSGSSWAGAGPAAGAAAAAQPAAAGLAAAAARKPGKPNKKWKVPVGTKFNNPMVPKDRFVIERHLLRAIRNTPRGEKIIISAYSLDRGAFADALIRAKKRGVKVQVLLNDHLVTGAQVRIQRVLGNNTKKSSFLKRCVSGCRADENEYNNLHSKFYLFSRTGRNRNVVMLGSQNMTLNAVRWQWNDLWTTAGKKTLFDQFEALFNDMRPDWDKRRASYTFCDSGRVCPAGDMQKYHNVVFPRHTTPTKDVVLDILNNVQCVYTDPGGFQKRTMLRLSMHTMRGGRGNYIADKLRDLYAQGCNLRVNYGLMGFHTKQHIGAPTARGRVPLRSTGFNLRDDVPTGDPEIDSMPEAIERYTHHKYFVLRGSYKGVIDSNIVWTGSTNWSSLGTPQDEILFTIHGRGVVRDYLDNFNLMWKKPFSRDAYTTTYSSWRMVDGRRVGVDPMVTVEPDGLRGGGSTWEND
ncbi:phospholipase D-like domain-containing protein [Nocardioides renjunii]|uniref:phospholipase D-like domain-containing protein n=1 Tax=Nocardioides renjunii TaxID=3095075 RepID=UPI002AFE36E4|nr:phospholipase D-like domain-containing protein [Nocardioides sp. S-34]WQQ23457.1 phospholipase D-like domain-containing protein [Nocardioides sp. S-34]